MLATPGVAIGQKVRLYDGESDWFYDGEVISDEGDHVLVDYADWTVRYTKASLHMAYELYEHYLHPSEPGEIVADYRQMFSHT